MPQHSHILSHSNLRTYVQIQKLYFCLLLTARLHWLIIPLIAHAYLSDIRPLLEANFTLNGHLDSFSTWQLLAFQCRDHTNIICFQIPPWPLTMAK